MKLSRYGKKVSEGGKNAKQIANNSQLVGMSLSMTVVEGDDNDNSDD